MTVKYSGAGTVEMDPANLQDGSYREGVTVELKAVADDGYRFDHWEGDLTDSDNPASIVMDDDKTVKAVFVLSDCYAIAPIVAPAEGGEIRLQPPQDSTGYAKDTQVRLAAIASPGFEFDHWEGDVNGSTNPASVVMDGNKKITAVFGFSQVLKGNVDPAGSGTITLEPSQSPGGYAEGTQVTVTAVAGEGYRFDHWSGALSGSDNPATIAMTSAKEVVAYFTKSFPWQGILGGVVGGVFILIPPSYPVIRRLRSRAPREPVRR